jgi:PPOX class probable F420-dependent enzyme
MAPREEEMTAQIPEGFQDLLQDGTRAYAYLATTMADGSPQVTPVWFDVKDGLIRVNTAEGRTKWRNMRRRDRVALVIADPKNPYRYIQIRGVVDGWTLEGARAHIDRLAGKYHGAEHYSGPAGEQRVTFTIRPEAVSILG